MFRSENTASALNKTPGPSSNVNTILVCRESKQSSTKLVTFRVNWVFLCWKQNAISELKKCCRQKAHHLVHSENSKNTLNGLSFLGITGSLASMRNRVTLSQSSCITTQLSNWAKPTRSFYIQAIERWFPMSALSEKIAKTHHINTNLKIRSKMTKRKEEKTWIPSIKISRP